MRVLRTICLAAVFTLILAIPQKNKNHQIENSKTIQDVEREANKTEIPRRLLDSPDEKNEKFYFLQIRHRRNDRIKSNAKSSTLRKEENDEQSTLVSMSDSPKKIDSSDTNFMDIDIIMRNRTSRSEDTDIYAAEFSEIEEDDSFNSLLTRLFEALQNDSAKDDRDILNGSNSINNSSDDEDRCQKWLDNRERIERAFPGSIDELPACPCQYPNDIFYNDMIWDKNRRKKFRWRDATNDPQRSVYKNGASFCVRSLASPGTKTMGGQHCCYDENRKLLTRGSGAGTPYIVNPEVSFVLHDKVDLLPWRLCKGDFTRCKMDWTTELEITSKKLIPRLGRRAGQNNLQEENKSDDDLLESPISLSSGKSVPMQRPVVPPRSRKTGWGDELKSGKSKMTSNIAEQERFRAIEKEEQEDDIPVIPDLDEIQEDNISSEIASAPTINANRVTAYEELDTDLVKNAAFTSLDGVSLSLLADKLYNENLVKEPDEVWNWNLLFTQISSEINSEAQEKIKT